MLNPPSNSAQGRILNVKIIAGFRSHLILQSRYVAHLWGDDMRLVREKRVAIYCVLLAGLLIFWDGLCSDLWRLDNG